MHYEGHIIRPPSEANSIILQVTVGCSHNKCTFCGSYMGRQFKIKSEEIIQEDIEFARHHCRTQRRVFLCDGDGLIIPQPRLLQILMEIEEKLPWITRVGIYANTKSLKRKSLKELMELEAHGLKIVYMGLESGDDKTLSKVCKKADSATIVTQGRKVRQAGMKLSITVLLGLAGPERSGIHARETGRVLTEMDPEYIGALSLMLIPGTPMYQDWKAGDFILPEPEKMLMELRTMIANTHISQGLFFANHASNYLPIRARLPRDRESAIQIIDKALAGNIPLRPDWMRAL